MCSPHFPLSGDGTYIILWIVLFSIFGHVICIFLHHLDRYGNSKNRFLILGTVCIRGNCFLFSEFARKKSFYGMIFGICRKFPFMVWFSEFAENSFFGSVGTCQNILLWPLSISGKFPQPGQWPMVCDSDFQLKNAATFHIELWVVI